MYTSIYQNSYIVAIIVFIILLIIFYVFKIGATTEITSDGKIVKKFNWKYPVAISLIVWLVWHFWLFSPKETSHDSDNYFTNLTSSPVNYKQSKTKDQSIILDNWL